MRNSMSITILVAFDDNRLIGVNGKLPWHIPNDLKFFKRITQGHPIIMGRKTWDGLPVKPLPGRVNFVLSRSQICVSSENDGPFYFNDILSIIKVIEKDAFIIGGAQVDRKSVV